MPKLTRIVVLVRSDFRRMFAIELSDRLDRVERVVVADVGAEEDDDDGLDADQQDDEPLLRQLLRRPSRDHVSPTERPKRMINFFCCRRFSFVSIKDSGGMKN